MTFLSKGPLHATRCRRLLRDLATYYTCGALCVPHMSRPVGRGGTVPLRIGQRVGVEAWVGPVRRDMLLLSGVCGLALVLLLPFFISRAAQRLHVDVVCLSEWDVIYPALPCPAVPASKQPLQPAALLSLSQSLLYLCHSLLLYGHRIGRRTVSWPSPVALLIIFRKSMLVLLSLRRPVFCPFTFVCVCVCTITPYLLPCRPPRWVPLRHSSNSLSIPIFSFFPILGSRSSVLFPSGCHRAAAICLIEGFLSPFLVSASPSVSCPTAVCNTFLLCPNRRLSDLSNFLALGSSTKASRQC